MRYKILAGVISSKIFMLMTVFAIFKSGLLYGIIGEHVDIGIY